MKLVIFASILAMGTAKGCNKEDCTEKVKTDCMCTMEYDPVCGCNQKTYSNACTAQCHGITKFVKGECPN
jgi:hypothetical protein